MIYNKNFKEIIKDLDKNKTLIITDPPYNVGWKYDSYKDNLSENEYLDLFKNFKGFKLVVIHYIEDIIKYIVPTMGVPTKCIQWVYNSNMPRNHRTIAFFNCKPDMNKVKRMPKQLDDKRNYDSNGDIKLVRINDWWKIPIVVNVSKEKEDYSCQIPEKVIERIIKTVAENEIIFDPFMGTGTTLAVANKLNKKYIGADISEKAYNITKKRLQKLENNLFNGHS
jgi:DNA modification methylase